MTDFSLVATFNRLSMLELKTVSSLVLIACFKLVKNAGASPVNDPILLRTLAITLSGVKTCEQFNVCYDESVSIAYIIYLRLLVRIVSGPFW